MNTKEIRYFLRFVPDRVYLKLCYYLKMHKRLNLKNPRTFNEKMQWLKIYNRKPEYTIMVDKYRVREYIKKKIGEEYLIPLVGGPWESVERIDFDALPNQFVLKCNHDSGSVVICKDKITFDIESAKKKLDYCIKHNFWYLGREWPYKNVKPCIIAEKYMINESNSNIKRHGIRDYKFYCFNGIPHFLYISENLDNHDDARISFVTMDWKKAEFHRTDYKEFDILPSKPKNFEEMIKLAKKLSKGIPFIRTDFYEVNEKVYFSELTLYSGGGFVKFYPEEWDLKLGNLI